MTSIQLSIIADALSNLSKAIDNIAVVLVTAGQVSRVVDPTSQTGSSTSVQEAPEAKDEPLTTPTKKKPVKRPQASKPSLQVGQTWKTRRNGNAKIVACLDEPYGSHSRYFMAIVDGESQQIKYTPTGFCVPGRFTPLDLVELLPDSDHCEQQHDTIQERTHTQNQSIEDPKSTPEESPVTSVVLNAFNPRNRYILERALVQYARMDICRAKILLDGSLPVTVDSFANSVHANRCKQGLERVKGVVVAITTENK